MKKALLAFILLILGGCVSKTTVNKITFLHSYSSPIYPPQTFTHSPQFSEKYTEELVLHADPKIYGRLRGTPQAYPAKITFNYSIKPESDQRFALEFSGQIEYFSTLNIHLFNGKQTIGGVVEERKQVAAARVEGTYGDKLVLRFPDDIQVGLLVVK